MTSENLDRQLLTTLYQQYHKKGKSIKFKSINKGPQHIMKMFLNRNLVGKESAKQKQKHIVKLNAK